MHLNSRSFDSFFIAFVLFFSVRFFPAETARYNRACIFYSYASFIYDYYYRRRETNRVHVRSNASTKSAMKAENIILYQVHFEKSCYCNRKNDPKITGIMYIILLFYGCDGNANAGWLLLADYCSRWCVSGLSWSLFIYKCGNKYVI